MTAQDNIVAAIPRKVYSNAHAYHINSISINSDGETYISADDLRVNLWNLNISDQSFSKYILSSAELQFICNVRYRGYQTSQYGGIDRGNHCCGVSSYPLQSLHVLELQRDDKAGRHA